MSTNTATDAVMQPDGVVDENDDHGHGLTDLGYVKVFALLVVITAIEVALSYSVDNLGDFFLPLLLILMAIKFVTVVSYFMHLKFDHKLFSAMFYTGLGLALMVFLGAMLTFHFFSS